MFSVRGAMAVIRMGAPRAAAASMAASTAAAPLMSVFMVSMPAAVLSESPPESKVMPLPTRTTCGTCPRTEAAVAGRYSARTSRGGCVDPRETPSRPPRRSAAMRSSSQTSTDTSGTEANRSTKKAAKRSGVSELGGSLTRSRARATDSAMRAPRPTPASTAATITIGGRRRRTRRASRDEGSPVR